MDMTKLLLNAYYEALYERIQSKRELLKQRISGLVCKELERLGFGDLGSAKIDAYREACVAFLEERAESYNPVGYQYIYSSSGRKRASELQSQLDWYNSGQEFARLVDSARQKAESELVNERMDELAEELIEEFGAFPDSSIISGYESEPVLSKLPDYVVSRAIEELLR